jgi:hypothetical protein
MMSFLVGERCPRYVPMMLEMNLSGEDGRALLADHIYRAAAAFP